MRKGLERGIKQGVYRGIKQGAEQTSNEFIINMLKENLDIKSISRITNKSEDEIIEIKKSL